MNTRALQSFIKVYEKKSITAAAKEIFISPQGLSKIIKQLEIELDAELFFRGTHGMEATQSGELLYARARHICYLIEDIKKEISIFNGSRSSLNLIVSYSATFIIPLDTIYTFTEENPDIQIKIKEYPDTFPLNDLFQEQADVGIVLGHEEINNCSYDILLQGEIVLVVSLNNPLADKDEISIMDLENETLVIKSIEAGKDHSLLVKCMEMGISPVIKHESENLAAVHDLCISQNVVGVSIDFLEKAFSNTNLKIIKLREKISQNLYYISKNREIQNKAILQFHNYLKEQRFLEK